MLARRTLLAVSLPVLVLAACSIAAGSGVDLAADSGTPLEPTQRETPQLRSISTTTEASLVEVEWESIGLTYQQPDGNRVVRGSGQMPTARIDVPLRDMPLWVVGVPLERGSLWLAVLEGGGVQAFQARDHEVSAVQLNIPALPAGTPPALIASGSEVWIVPPSQDASPYTHPFPSPQGAQTYIDVEGGLRVRTESGVSVLPANALPDARILADGDGHLLFLSAPSTEYAHGVLGDTLESTAITEVDVTADPSINRLVELESGEVIEGLAPIWVDLDGDGEREVIVTQSSRQNGARLVIYGEGGDILAKGAPIGQGFRWRHQIAAAQFIRGGLLEIAVVRTPHIGGVLELYALEHDRLVIMAQLEGFRSHQIGSRNLDGALAGDLNGDGIMEIVLPDQSQGNLVGVQMTDGRLEISWEAALGGTLRTNLAGVSLSDGGIGLGAGIGTGVLHIWLP